MRFLFFTLFSLVILGLSSQNYAQPLYNQRPDFLNANGHWLFGTKGGVDFSSGKAQAIQGSMTAPEGCASVSDPTSGKLLFYSNGEQCWNANHLVMVNGDSLLGNSKYSASGDGSTQQGVCIVPVIGSPGKYYLFSLLGMTASFPDYSKGSLFYSVVDMNVNAGIGAVESGKKNIPLNRDVLSEGMAAVPGNDCDVWLLLHLFQDNKFLAYHLTKNGIDTVPVVSNTGGAPKLTSYSAGPIVFSPDRGKIAIPGAPYGTAYDVGTMIARFDVVTGKVSDPITLAIGTRGLCFSPDNAKFYVCGNRSGIFQYSLSVHDSATIKKSEMVVSATAPPGVARLYHDTIYYCGAGNTSYISRINQPNLDGAASMFEANAIALLPGTTASVSSLGNDVVFPIPDSTSVLTLDSIICPRINFSLKPQMLYGHYKWDNGSTGDSRNITEPGEYWVEQNDGCHFYRELFKIQFYDFPVPVINVNVLDLGLTHGYHSYQWLKNKVSIPGATDAQYTALENGTYSVVVSNDAGCTDTAASYEVTNATAIGSIEHLAKQIKIFPNPAKDVVYINSPAAVSIRIFNLEGKLIETLKNASTISLKKWANGLYWLTITDPNGIWIKTEKLIKQ